MDTDGTDVAHVAADAYLTTEGASRYVGGVVPPSTLRAWRSRAYVGKGMGPRYIKLGPRKYAYRKSDLDAWLRAHEVQP
jgi:hypothetical protein